MISPRVTSSRSSYRSGPPQSSGEVSISTAPVPFAGTPDAATREAWIRTTAYYRAERRGFAPGGELEDWLDAEREINQRYPIQQRRLLTLRGHRSAR